MQISLAITTLLASVAAASNITYNVVSYVADNQTLGVVVDNNLYPLTATSEASTLLHVGDAPAATTGYKYAILDKSSLSVIEQENFTRSPISEDKTLNEYYNRSWNTMNMTKLPTILSPVQSMHRVQSDLHIDGEIPTIHITGNQTAIDYMHKNNYADIDTDGLKMTYINPRDVKTFEDVTLAVSGFSTRSLSKLSYKLKIPKKSGDLYDYRRFKLRAMATDISYMREELGYGICESVGLPCPQYSYARLFINDQPIGLFGFADHMKNPWPQNTFANGEKYNQGPLILANPNRNKNASALENAADALTNSSQSTTASAAAAAAAATPTFTSDLAYLGDNVTEYSISYKVREDPSEGTTNFTQLMDFTKFIAGQPNTTNTAADAISLWNERIDVTSFLRGMAMEIVISDADGYLGNGNNYFMYQDLERGQYVFGNQDLDLAMGTSFSGGSEVHDGNYTKFPGVLTRPLSTRLLAIPEFKQEFDSLVRNMTEQLVNTNVLFPRIDSLYNLLEQDVAWDKKLPRVGPVDIGAAAAGNITLEQIPFMFGINGTFPESVAFNRSMSLKNWVEFRSNNLLNFFAQNN